MSDCFYLAYGSNLHPLRLQDRLPSAKLLARVEIQGYRLCFHKHGGDDSGKCDLASGANTDLAYGAIYQLSELDFVTLDVLEGGYSRQRWALTWQGAPEPLHVYTANEDKIQRGMKPFSWYQQLVLAGARHLGFPPGYIQAIEQQAVMADPDLSRHHQHQQLLTEVWRHNQQLSAVAEIPWLRLNPAR